MKLILFMAATLGVPALANTIPSVLPNGSYDVSCIAYSVNKYDDGEVSRWNATYAGTLHSETTNDVTVTHEQITSTGIDGSETTQTITESKAEALGNNQYRLTQNGSVSYVGEDGSTQVGHTSWVRVVEVKDNYEINLTIQFPNQAEKKGFGESYVLNPAPGKYTVVSYVRAGARQEPKTYENGAVTRGYEILANGSTCEYTKK